MLAFLDREGVPNPLLAFGDSFIKPERYMCAVIDGTLDRCDHAYHR